MYDDDTYEHRNVNWLRLNRQSFYHNQKQQRVPIDRYRFRTNRKLIGSVSHDQVPYRYLDALPNRSCKFCNDGRVGNSYILCVERTRLELF